MIAVILLTIFVGLFAAMTFAPLAIEEVERAETERRHAVRPTPIPAALPERRSAATDREPLAA